jgi:hypothetical protein
LFFACVAFFSPRPAPFAQQKNQGRTAESNTASVLQFDQQTYRQPCAANLQFVAPVKDPILVAQKSLKQKHTPVL